MTGCARTEGFYKIDIKEKAKYLQSQRRQLQCQANVTAEEQVLGKVSFLITFEGNCLSEQ